MNPYLLIAVCAFIFAGQAVFFKMFAVGYRRGLASHFLNNIFFLSVVVFIFVITNGLHLAENPDTYIYASIFGVVWVMAMVFYIKAMSMGPTGLVALFFAFGIVIPIIVDLTVLGTLVTIFQIVGLALLFVSFYIGNKPPKGEMKSISPQFIITCIISFLINGLIMATVKLHQGAMPGIDVEVFVLYGFAVSVLTSVCCFILFHTRESRQEKISYGYMFKSPKYYLSVAGGGATTAFGNILMVFIAGQVPAAIQFPLMNGGTSIIAAIISIFVFQEKLSKRMAAVFAIGIAAMAIINI
jgi:drug/metabolite transporter (DMT)-like permease